MTERIDTPGLMLKPGAGCVRGLQWNIELAGWSAGRVAQRLLARGFADSSWLSGLVLVELAEKNQLVLVPATDRIQLRLDIGVPPSQRTHTALKLGRWLADQIDRH